MDIVDIIILLFLLCGAIIGFKRGFFQSAVLVAGIILVIILSFYLKNPLSVIFYTYLPFFKFTGDFAGVSVINILIYEGIAFFIVLTVLIILLKVILNITKLFEKLLKMTVVLSIPSKLLGAVFGFAEYLVISFAVLFVLNQFLFFQDVKQDSKYVDKILSKTPYLSEIASDAYNSFKDIYSLKSKYVGKEDKSEFNKEALDVLLRYDVITIENADKLVKKEKIDIDNVEDILSKYR